MFVTLKNRALLKIYFIPVVVMLTQSMTGSISILYALELGANVFQVNLITTMHSTMAVLLLVPFGILSDSLGRRPMLLFSRITMILGVIMRVFATDPNHLLLASFFGGFSGGGLFPILLSMIGDIAEPKERQEAISIMFLFSSIGMFLGPIISSYLLILPDITLRNIYEIVLVASLGILLYMGTQIYETKPRTTTSPKNTRIRYHVYIADLLRQKNFQVIFTFTVLYFFSRSIINTYIPIYARIDLNLSNAEIASFSVYSNLAIILIRFSFSSFLARVPTRPSLISALILGGVASLASPFINNYVSIVIIFFFSGLSYGAVRILTSVLVASNSTSENRGFANSIYEIAQSVGNITKLLTTPFVETLGLNPVFIIGGLTCLISIIPTYLRKNLEVTKAQAG